MRPRSGLRGSNRNEILGSLNQKMRAERLRTERKEQGRIRDEQKFAWEEDPKDFNKLKDHQLAGVTELAVLRDGKIDSDNDDYIVIGDREHKLQKGRMRIISKTAIDDTLIPILQEREFKDAIIGAILSDRTGRICRMMLNNEAYAQLAPNADGFDKHFAGRKAPVEIVEAEGRPEFFLGYHESSKPYALGVQKLSVIVDNTNITYDDDIMNWREKYNKMRNKEPGHV